MNRGMEAGVVGTVPNGTMFPDSMNYDSRVGL